ncbi:MAG TPA: class I SAM-dependent methyltransferase [Candidatus Acidoferrum sp.]|jgi:SAM-dependent methyltransferase
MGNGNATTTEQSASPAFARDYAALPRESGYCETTKHYLELAATEDQLLSFRYLRPWYRDLPVLDLGCAKGAYLRQFSQGSIGVDVSNPNLERCEELGLQVVAADLNCPLLFSSGSFPVIFCSHVLEHVDAPIALLRECRRILPEQGLLLLGLPIETSLVNRIRGQRYFYHHPGHLYSFSLENIDVLLKKTGFEVLRLYFEPRIIRGQPWLSWMQRLPLRWMYLLALAYWVVARKISEPRSEKRNTSGIGNPYSSKDARETPAQQLPSEESGRK